MGNLKNRTLAGTAALLLLAGAYTAQAGDSHRNDADRSASEKSTKTATHARGTVYAVDPSQKQVTITIAAPADQPARTRTIHLSDAGNLRMVNDDKDQLVKCTFADVQVGMYLVASGDVGESGSKTFDSSNIYVAKSSEDLNKLLPVAEKGMEDTGFMPENKDNATSSTTQNSMTAPPY